LTNLIRNATTYISQIGRNDISLYTIGVWANIISGIWNAYVYDSPEVGTKTIDAISPDTFRVMLL